MTTAAEIQAKLDQLMAGETATAPEETTSAPSVTEGIDTSYSPSNVLRQTVGQGVLMGYGDEAKAAFRAALPGIYDETGELFGKGGAQEGDYAQRYKALQSKFDEQNKAFEKEHPIGSTLMQIAGAATTGGVGASKAIGSKIVQNAPTALRALTYPAIGAVEGGLYGYGAGTPGNRMDAAQRGAAWGTAGGAVIPPVIRGLGKVGGTLAAPIVAKTGRGKEWLANRQLARALIRDGYTPEQARARIQELGPEAALVDVGKNTATLGEVVAQRPGEAMTTASDFLEARRGEQGGMILRALRKAVGDTGKALRIPEEGGAFSAALKKMVPINEDMVRLLNRPMLKDAWKKAQQLAGEKDIDLQSWPEAQALMRSGLLKAEAAESRELAKLGDTAPGASSPAITEISTELLHWLKKGMDDLLEPKRNAGGKMETLYGKNEMRGRMGTRREFTELAKKLNPDYKKVLKDSAYDLRLDSAVRKGADALRPSVTMKHIDQMLKSMTPAEVRAYRNGMLETIEQRISGAGETGADATSAVLRNGRKLRRIFGKESKQLMSTLKDIRFMAQTENRVLSNSATARRQAATADFEGGIGADAAGALTDAVLGNKLGLLSRGSRAVQRGLNRPPEAVSNQVGKMLFNNDPAAINQILNRIPQNQRIAPVGGRYGSPFVFSMLPQLGKQR